MHRFFYSVCTGILLLGNFVYLTQQQSLQLLMNPRNGNRINLTCVVTGQFSGNEIDFYLNQRNVNELQDLQFIRREGSTNINIIIEIIPRHEGSIFCGICSDEGICSIMSNIIGPIAADPRYSENSSVPLFYVGEVGSSATLLSIIPLGRLRELYSYTWFNGTSHNVNTKKRYHINPDQSLSISSLQLSDAGRFLLSVQVNGTPTTFLYRNNRYELHVQELPAVNSPESIIKIHRSGESLSQLIMCRAQGYPNLTIHWTHNNLDVSAHPDKYLVIQTQGGTNQLNSSLTILNLNSTDNGLIRCSGSIQGCNPASSTRNCERQSFTSQASTTMLSFITGDFHYRVVILEGQNIELRITLGGNPIPAPVQIFINYMEDGTTRATVVTAQGMFTNTTHINLYIPSHDMPGYSRFKLKIALGTNSNNAGPFRPPTKDIVYDINDPDDVCETQKILTIVLPCTLGVISVTIIMAILLATINRQRLINKLKLEAGRVAQSCMDQDANGADKIQQFKHYFPMAYRTYVDGTEECSDNYSDHANRKQDVCAEKPAQNGISRIQPDGLPMKATRVSADWIDATDRVLCLVRDKKKQFQLMHHLSTAIREEQTYWSKVSINRKSTHTVV